MAQEYTISKVLPTPPKLWKNGIVYYEVELTGYPRPVSVGKKQPPQEGWTIYGNIEETPVGLPDKFTSANRPEAPTQVATGYKGKDEDAIRAQWAIGRAVEMSIANGKLDMEGIEVDASILFAMVDRIKQRTPEVVKQDRGDFASVDLPPVELYDE